MTNNSCYKENPKDPHLNSLLNLPFLSHGHATLTDVDASARFYSEFLGFEVVKTSPKTLVARLGSNTVVVGVTLGQRVLNKVQRAWLENAHFGLDVRSQDQVAEAHTLALEYKNEFGNKCNKEYRNKYRSECINESKADYIQE